MTVLSNLVIIPAHKFCNYKLNGFGCNNNPLIGRENPPKMLTHQSLLFLATVLCTAGASSSTHPLHKRQASTNLPQERQASMNPHCNVVQGNHACSSGFYEDYAYLLALCNGTGTAVAIQMACRSNSMGEFCSVFNIDTLDAERGRKCGTSPAACSPECRNFLTTTRAELGCCVQLINSSRVFGGPLPLFSNALWVQCNVETVTEECTPSSFDLPEIDPTCTDQVLSERLQSRVLCRREYIDSLNHALSATEGCEPLEEDSTCEANEQGRYCELLDTDSLSTLANDNCRNTSTCDPRCVGTLRNITSTAGCCFTSRFNGTDDTPRNYLSYEFWRRCGLTPPGPCAQRYDDSDTRVSDEATTNAPSGKIISFAIALLAIIFVFSQY